MALAAREPVPVRQMTDTLPPAEIEALAGEVPEWEIVDRHHLARRFDFKNYAQALAFVNQVSDLAEAMDHHPEVCLGWGYSLFTLWTHRLDGLSINDFILAARIDQIPHTPAST